MKTDQIGPALQDKLGTDCVIANAQDIAAWTTDWRGMYRGQAAAVVRPRTARQVSECVAFCSANRIPVIPRGGNTGLCGAATPDDNPANVVISLDRMNAVKRIDPLANTMVAEAGCILGDLQRAVAEHDRLFPLSLAAEDSAQLGGNLATNAGGVNVLRYGMARDLVLGLEVVLPSGEIWNGLRTLRKDNTGYDMKHLFLGSEGTLGIITAAALKIFPATPARAVTLVAVESAQQALALLSVFQRYCGHQIDAFEYFSGACLELVLETNQALRSPFAGRHKGYVLIEVAGGGQEETLQQLVENALSESFERGTCIDAVIATSSSQAQALWQLREDISEAQRIDGPHLKHDISLPIERISEFIDITEERLFALDAGIRLYVFGHFGDGNLHYNLSRPRNSAADYFKNGKGDALTDLIMEQVASLGGSFSAEHGVGQLKRKYLRAYKSDLELRMMEGIKKMLDPAGIMNPGKIF